MNHYKWVLKEGSRVERRERAALLRHAEAGENRCTSRISSAHRSSNTLRTVRATRAVT